MDMDCLERLGRQRMGIACLCERAAELHRVLPWVRLTHKLSTGSRSEGRLIWVTLQWVCAIGHLIRKK